jgi:hypothetical protein
MIWNKIFNHFRRIKVVLYELLCSYRELKLTIIAVMAAVAIPFGAYTISPLFINTTLNEPLLISANTVSDDSKQILF